MSFEHATSKLGNVKPETRLIAEELYEAAQGEGHDIWFFWGMGPSKEHSTGLALDLMVRNKEAGDFLRNYIWQNRSRLRLRHVIWWQRITSTVTRPGVIRRMRDRGNATQNHYDHVHVLFMGGEYRQPAGSAENGSLVARMQRALNVTADGKWGPITDRVAILMRSASKARRGWPEPTNESFNVKHVQEIVGTTVDGIWGGNSQAALTNWIIKFQHIMDVAADGRWGPKTDGKLLTLRRRFHNKY